MNIHTRLLVREKDKTGPWKVQHKFSTWRCEYSIQVSWAQDTPCLCFISLHWTLVRQTLGLILILAACYLTPSSNISNVGSFALNSLHLEKITDTTALNMYNLLTWILSLHKIMNCPFGRQQVPLLNQLQLMIESGTLGCQSAWRIFSISSDMCLTVPSWISQETSTSKCKTTSEWLFRKKVFMPFFGPVVTFSCIFLIIAKIYLI